MSADSVRHEAQQLGDGQYRFVEDEGWQYRADARDPWAPSRALAEFNEAEGLRIIGECPWSPNVEPS